MFQGKPFRVRYTPRYEAEMARVVSYITYELYNPSAADRLVEETFAAVYRRAQYPTVTQKFYFRKGGLPHYRIYVGSYVVYYVVIGRVMELRRFVYGRRNLRFEN